jgi:predicted secreted acid phosphatase
MCQKTEPTVNNKIYRGADKSLARPGRKQATATKLWLLQATQKQSRRLSVQPGLRRSNDLRVGRKMATFQLFFQSGRAKDLSALLYTHASHFGVVRFQDHPLKGKILA